MLFGPALPFPQYFVELWQRFNPVLFASLLLLPLIAIDVVRTSNRIAGPLVRLRRAIRTAGTHTDVPPLRFRSTDLLDGIADEFNAMLRRFEETSRFERAMDMDGESETGNESETDSEPVEVVC
jgi:hypothetical protein